MQFHYQAASCFNSKLLYNQYYKLRSASPEHPITLQSYWTMLAKAIIPSLILLVVALAFSLTCEVRFGLNNFGTCLSSPVAMIFGRDSGSTSIASSSPAAPRLPSQPANSRQQEGLCYRPCEPQRQAASQQRPACLKWHRARRGETQWKLARHYAGRANKWHWMKSMRWVSRKGANDSVLKVGESVCVNWRRSV